MALPSKPRITKPKPGDRLSGLVYTRDEAVSQALDREIRPVCRIITATASTGEALRMAENGNIQICFVHVADNDDDGMGLVRQFCRTHPQKSVFIIADRKDPDMILEGLRLGVVDIIPPAADGSERFLPGVQRALGRTLPDGRNGFVYALFSLKGGQGVTSLSINLCDQIQALTPMPVLLLDLNLFMGDVGAAIDIAPDFTPFELIRDLSRMDENLLFSSIRRHQRGFYVLPSPASISDAERIHRDQVSAMLTLLKRHFSHIVIDLPHDFSERSLAATEASDQLIVLVEPDLLSVKSAQQVIGFFQELSYGDDRLALVLNRLSKESEMQPEDVRLVLKHPLMASVANDWTALSRASQKGEPLAVAHGRRRITRDIRDLAIQLTGISPPVQRKGWWRWFNGLRGM